MAQITITAQFPRRRLPEGSAASFTAKAFDDSFTATAPTSASYRVDNPDTCENLIDWTTLSASTSMAISLNGATQLLRNQSCNEERRRLTVKLNDGLSTQTTKSYDWYITNALGVS